MNTAPATVEVSVKSLTHMIRTGLVAAGSDKDLQVFSGMMFTALADGRSHTTGTDRYIAVRAWNPDGDTGRPAWHGNQDVAFSHYLSRTKVDELLAVLKGTRGSGTVPVTHDPVAGRTVFAATHAGAGADVTVDPYDGVWPSIERILEFDDHATGGGAVGFGVAVLAKLAKLRDLGAPTVAQHVRVCPAVRAGKAGFTVGRNVRGVLMTWRLPD